jgi:hypothetical protein
MSRSGFGLTERLPDHSTFSSATRIEADAALKSLRAERSRVEPDGDGELVVAGAGERPKPELAEPRSAPAPKRNATVVSRTDPTTEIDHPAAADSSPGS